MGPAWLACGFAALQYAARAASVSHMDVRTDQSSGKSRLVVVRRR